VVERFNTNHHKIHIPNEQTLIRLPEAIANMSEPMFGQDAIGFYLLSEQVSKDVKVVQSGQGADEVFGGYFWYNKMNEAKGTHLERFRQFYFDRDHDEMIEALTPAFVDRDYTAETMKALLEAPNADTFIDAVFRADTTMLIVDDPVKRVDNMTMAHGLEARVPFLDHELVELAAKMPPHMKLQDGGKYVLKQISRGLIPDSVIDRKKGYFPVPALKYVRGEFLEFMQDVLNSRKCRDRGVYQRAYLEKLLAKPEDYLTRIQGSKLWHMALLEYWLQDNGI
jgi:asparagine synthase (glutamine-hydrolysing)